MNIVLIIPGVVFVGVVMLTRSPWRLIPLLLVLCPFVAASVLLAYSLPVGEMMGDVTLHSFSNLAWFSLTFYLFAFTYAIYPVGAWLAAGTLSIWAVCKPWISLESIGFGRRIALGVVLGAVVGALFAPVMFFSYRSVEFSARFGNLISGRDPENRQPPGEALPMSVLTGVVDGIIVVLLTKRETFSEGPAGSPAQTSLSA